MSAIILDNNYRFFISSEVPILLVKKSNNFTKLGLLLKNF